MKPVFENLTKGDTIGERRIELSRADLVRYAGASGDFNPIHWNERFARSVELPGVIAHGMLTMGAAVQLATDWVGDAGAIIDYQTRFTKPVPVADAPDGNNPNESTNALNISGKIGALDEEARTARVDLTVSAADENGAEQKVLLKTQVLVQF
ncbi:MAG: MaoC family dehydratase [Rothia sp. (in: high G+C Gram-positive bacteria)]|uniref:MaoC family dehydratase n=1 Tax=Rothia sp. (in: high G+C Gram-positive bacteria) TaxID=1885016 RepID=UPI0026DF9530|nr:MaoC family dehydratase [Rothia sp. (in: high G+C Gram-positive bacteria)]MDO5751118.1 MaoC family dehydratase [Rothia sp. (in: high G+C Gram-positive bacteria)]